MKEGKPDTPPPLESAADATSLIFEIDAERLLGLEILINELDGGLSGVIERARAIGLAIYAFELAEPSISADPDVLENLRKQVRNQAVLYADYAYKNLTDEINAARQNSETEEPKVIAALRAIYEHPELQDAFKKGASRRLAEATVWEIWRRRAQTSQKQVH